MAKGSKKTNPHRLEVDTTIQREHISIGQLPVGPVGQELAPVLTSPQNVDFQGSTVATDGGIQGSKEASNDKPMGDSNQGDTAEDTGSSPGGGSPVEEPLPPLGIAQPIPLENPVVATAAVAAALPGPPQPPPVAQIAPPTTPADTSLQQSLRATMEGQNLPSHGSTNSPPTQENLDGLSPALATGTGTAAAPKQSTDTGKQAARRPGRFSFSQRWFIAGKSLFCLEASLSKLEEEEDETVVPMMLGKITKVGIGAKQSPYEVKWQLNSLPTGLVKEDLVQEIPYAKTEEMKAAVLFFEEAVEDEEHPLHELTDETCKKKKATPTSTGRAAAAISGQKRASAAQAVAALGTSPTVDSPEKVARVTRSSEEIPDSDSEDGNDLDPDDSAWLDLDTPHFPDGAGWDAEGYPDIEPGVDPPPDVEGSTDNPDCYGSLVDLLKNV